MKREKFIEVLEILETKSGNISKLYALKIDMIDYDEPYSIVISTLLEEVYGKEGNDWIEWYCWENDFGKGTLKAYNSEEKPIAYSPDSLWELVEELRKEM